jgi:hypothetical protein
MSSLSLPLSPSAVARARRKGRLARLLAGFIAALQESRMRQARAEIARYRHLLPADMESAGNRATARSEDQLPFALFR